MKSENDPNIRNPFGVMDVPDPNDDEVTQFAGKTMLEESAADENAKIWSAGDTDRPHRTIEGKWSSRWNGGADPTIAGDTPGKWKQGQAEAKVLGERVYLLFDWVRRASGTDRCQARRTAAAGREVYQFE